MIDYDVVRAEIEEWIPDGTFFWLPAGKLAAALDGLPPLEIPQWMRNGEPVPKDAWEYAYENYEGPLRVAAFLRLRRYIKDRESIGYPEAAK